ncbi:MAG: UbiA prenyltransferase family protein [bacterium]
MKLPPLLRALRPLQWTKNLVIAGPLVFVPQAWSDPDAWLRTIGVIAAFCALASGTYLLNDLRDREADQHHPKKRNRPIASGQITSTTAIGMMVLLWIVGLGALAFIDRLPPLALAEPDQPAALVWIGLGYLAITLAYSLVLKHIPILDVILVALGFVMRAVAGGGALRVHVSPWLLMCTFLLMLMIALGKRRWEASTLEYAAKHRASLGDYDLSLIDQLLSMTAAMTVMAYTLYTFLGYQPLNGLGSNRAWLMLTIPNVLYGVARYLALIHVAGQGGEPEEVILRDRATLINIGVWILLSASILWATGSS